MKRKTIYEIADSTTELGVTLPINAIVQNIATKEVFSLNEKALSTDTLGSLNKSMLGGDSLVVGPASSTDNAIARFDGITGKLVQNSGAYIDDSGNVGISTTTPTEKLDVVGNIAVSGTVDGRDISVDGSKLDGIPTGSTIMLKDGTDNLRITNTAPRVEFKQTDSENYGRWVLDGLVMQWQWLNYTTGAFINSPFNIAVDAPSNALRMTATALDSTVNMNITSGKKYMIGGTQISTSALSDGDDLVKGPASSTVGYVAVADDTSGKSIKYVPVTVDDLGNVVIPGNATINGTLTTINSETLQVKDKNIEIAKVDTPTDDTADGGGITLLGATNKTITWVKSKLSWVFNQAVEIAGDLNVIGTIKTNGSQISTSALSDGADLVKGPASSVENSIPVFDDITGKLLKESSIVVNGDNMKPQLVTFKTPSELTGTNAMDFNLNQNWIVYLSGETTTITMTPITKSAVFTCNIEVVQDATGGRDLVLVDVDGKTIVNTQEFDFTTGGANERCFITIKYWLTGYRYLVDKYI